MEKMDIKKRCRSIFSESASGWAKFPKANLWGLHKQDVLQAGCPPCQSVEGTYRTKVYDDSLCYSSNHVRHSYAANGKHV